MQNKITPGAISAVALPTGEYAQAILGSHIDTHLGRVERPGFDVLYLDITNKPYFKIVGQAQVEPTDGNRGTWEYNSNTNEWKHVSLEAPGVYPVIYDHNGNPHIATTPHNGSQGWRYQDENLTLVTGDDTLNDQRRVGKELGLKGMWEYTHLNKVTIGQGETGCDVIIKNKRRILFTGEALFIRVRYTNGIWAIALTNRTPLETYIFWATEADLEVLPLLHDEPTPLPVGDAMLKSFERPFWMAPFFSHSKQYGDTPLNEHFGNSIWTPTGESKRLSALGLPLIVASNGDPTDVEVIDLIVAWWVSGANAEDLGTVTKKTLELPEKPIIAYLDQDSSVAWPASRPDWITERVWPSVQAYRNPNESLSDFEFRVTEMLKQVTSYGTDGIALTPAFYTRNGATSVEHILECMPLYNKWMIDFPIVCFMPFADRRPTGMLQHPEFREWAKAFLYAAPSGRPNRFDYWRPKGASEEEILKNKLGQSRAAIVLETYLREFILESLEDQPEQPPTPEPPGQWPNLLSELQEIRRKYPVSPTVDQCVAILNELAWNHRSEGFGLLRKDGGNRGKQPKTGINCSVDWSVSDYYKRGVDCLVATPNSELGEEGPAVPTWNDGEEFDLSRWIAPVEP
jgi:hypothetical protein